MNHGSRQSLLRSPASMEGICTMTPAGVTSTLDTEGGQDDIV